MPRFARGRRRGLERLVEPVVRHVVHNAGFGVGVACFEVRAQPVVRYIHRVAGVVAAAPGAGIVAVRPGIVPEPQRGAVVVAQIERPDIVGGQVDGIVLRPAGGGLGAPPEIRDAPPVPEQRAAEGSGVGVGVVQADDLLIARRAEGVCHNELFVPVPGVARERGEPDDKLAVRTAENGGLRFLQRYGGIHAEICAPVARGGIKIEIRHRFLVGEKVDRAVFPRAALPVGGKRRKSAEEERREQRRSKSADASIFHRQSLSFGKNI